MRLQLITTGFFSCEGGAMFGVVPSKIWEKRYPSKDNFCPMGLNIIFADYGDRKVVIDTGVGLKGIGKLKSYGFRSLKNIEQELRKMGVTPSEITDVILTHLHFDHCGGCTYINEQDEIQITFPNATHWVSLKQWEHSQSPTLLDQDAYINENTDLIHQAGLFKFIESDTEIFKDFFLNLFDGHTLGQIVPRFKYNDQIFCFTGDVLPTSAHLSPLWISAYDLFPIDSVSEKIRLLDQASAENWVLITSHDIYNLSFTIKKVTNFYKIKRCNDQFV